MPLSPLPWVSWVTSAVVRSQTKTSLWDAPLPVRSNIDTKARYRPSPEMAGVPAPCTTSELEPEDRS